MDTSKNKRKPTLNQIKRAKAEKILAKNCIKNNGDGYGPIQEKWIVDAMLEFSKIKPMHYERIRK